MRELLNPMRYGFYSVSLFFNKVLRRALPISLALLLVSTVYLAQALPAFRLLLVVELAFIALAASYPVLSLLRMKRFRKLPSVAYYFCVGNVGTMLGVLDFLRGKTIVQWNPVKGDAG